MMRSALVVLLTLALLVPVAATAQTGEETDPEPIATGVTEPIYEDSIEEIYRVETEHGTLFGKVVRPVDDEGVPVEDIPVILTYTPYKALYGGDVANDGVADFFVPRGYARAGFDVVGTSDSTGCYDYGGIRERETGAALVDFLGSQEWSNGNVGMIGGSYDGTTANAAAVEAPEHLKAIIPQVAIDRWYDYAFTGGMRHFVNEDDPSSQGFDTPLAFDFGFALIPPVETDDPQASAEVVAGRIVPCDQLLHTERAYVPDPVYDEFWDQRDYHARADNVEAAVLVEGGWLDHNVKHWDSTRFFMALPDDIDKHLVMGQWAHSSSRFSDAQDLRHAWFDHHLMGLDTGLDQLPTVQTQLNTQEDDERELEDAWPPVGTREAALRLTPEGTTDLDSLALDGTEAAFTDSDPALTEPQMLAETDPTGAFLHFRSEPLSEAVRISGGAVLDLVVETDATSTHFTPVLYEEAEDGTRTPITRGFLNARNRNGLDVSEPLTPGEPYTASVEFWDIDWQMAEGSRLGMVLASSNAAWALPDDNRDVGETRVTLAEGDAAGSVLRVPVSEGSAALGVQPEPEVPDPGTEPDPDVPGDGDGDGDGSGDPGTDPDPNTPPDPDAEPGVVADRVAGEGRIQTAVAVSEALGDAADTVVLARADIYADSLSGAPVAADLDAPVLLTSSDELASPTAAEIERLGASEVVLLGGTAAISEAVADQLRTEGLDVRRIGGANRFATAALLADALGGSSQRAFVVEGEHADPARGWPDAVSAAPYAAFAGQPVLLVTNDRLPAETADALAAQGVQETVVVGGSAAVSDAVVSQLDQAGHNARRLAGANRYATSVAVYDEAVAAGMDASTLWTVTGLDWPDALVTGPAVAALGHSMLLVDGQDLSRSQDSRAAIADAADAITRVRMVGGPGTITPEVAEEIAALAD